MSQQDAATAASTLEDATVRDRLALALDVPNRTAALALAKRFVRTFGVIKIGLELFVAEGPRIVRDVAELGCRVFLDLKLHDIPNTVERAAHRAGALGVGLLTLHTQGGPDMVAAGVRGLREGASEAQAGTAAHKAELVAPLALGVTVLTSQAAAPPEVLAERAMLARDAGCGGVVCAATDLPAVSTAAPRLLRVVPGIRTTGTSSADQRRIATPTSALAAGADLLVIGRTVTAAPDPDAAAASIVAEVTAAVAAPRQHARS